MSKKRHNIPPLDLEPALNRGNTIGSLSPKGVLNVSDTIATQFVKPTWAQRIDMEELDALLEELAVPQGATHLPAATGVDFHKMTLEEALEELEKPLQLPKATRIQQEKIQAKTQSLASGV